MGKRTLVILFCFVRADEGKCECEAVQKGTANETMRTNPIRPGSLSLILSLTMLDVPPSVIQW